MITTESQSARPWPQAFELNGLAFWTAPLPELLHQVERWRTATEATGRNRLIGFINPHVFNIACDDADVQAFLNRCDLLCIDGIGITLALLLRKGQAAPRVVAEHLFNRLLDGTANHDATNSSSQAVLVGVTPDAVAKAAIAINHRSQVITVSDCIDGFRSEQEYRDFLHKHQDVKMVLIGAASPGSEKIALLANKICSGCIIFHIGGGTINTLAGNKHPVPGLVSRCGLQWLHRMITEPHTRSRYVHGGWQFLKHVLSGQNAYPENSGRPNP